MPPQVKVIQSAIESRLIANDLSGLFTADLAWHGSNPPEAFSVEGALIEKLAGLAGVTVWLVKNAEDSAIANIEREIAKRSSERLVIVDRGSFLDWRWPEKRPSGNIRTTSLRQIQGDAPLMLVQRLVPLRFEIEDQANLTVLDVRERVRRSFSSEEVTNRFYSEFRKVHTLLAGDTESLGSIEGIKEYDNRHWYASVLMNRLMFLYFLEKKGFLDNDENYLASRLSQVRKSFGPDQFYGFYSNFLIPLFHDAIGSTAKKIDAKTAALIGDVPYLNGGIFAPHELELTNKIQIPDSVFEEIFGFFDSYRWHLDERTNASEGEINPEILGYIFEKYVNQKAQGAFYTKEDVTGFMTAGAILPVLIDRISNLTNRSPWHQLNSDPERYIFEALKFGIENELPEGLLPEGLNEYGIWDELADSSVGLPGERWREVQFRRDTVSSIISKIDSGQVSRTCDAQNLNLDLVALLCDWIRESEDDEFLGFAWDSLSTLTIVDPTCGSGAFLFAALDLMEELYELVFHTAQSAVSKDPSNSKNASRIVNEVSQHRSSRYYIRKKIVLENLFGVDIMAEATEIARLRLFLSLASCLASREDIEPLPDLDMNIKVGNILVGCSTFEDATAKFEGDLLAISQLETLGEDAVKLASAYNDFIDAQSENKKEAEIKKAKILFLEQAGITREALNKLYASELGIVDSEYNEWKQSHLPFHWFVEFPSVFKAGGFSAAVGNPPYIAKSKVTSYRFSGFKTDDSPDIYAPCMERGASIVSDDGGFAMIVPISFQFSDDYSLARDTISRYLPSKLVSTYSRNPSSLFDASVGVRSTILLGRRGSDAKIMTSFLRRWQDSYRPYLFETTTYAELEFTDHSLPWPRLGSARLRDLHSSLLEMNSSVAEDKRSHGPTIGFKETALYSLSVFKEDPPSWTLAGERTPQTKIGNISFESEKIRDINYALLCGRTAIWWWGMNGDDFDVTKSLLLSFPISSKVSSRSESKFLQFSKSLFKMQRNSPLVTKYAGKWMGNFDLATCREVTDEIDKLALSEINLAEYWSDILLADAWLAKATGERNGTLREWPFPL